MKQRDDSGLVKGPVRVLIGDLDGDLRWARRRRTTKRRKSGSWVPMSPSRARQSRPSPSNTAESGRFADAGLSAGWQGFGRNGRNE